MSALHVFIGLSIAWRQGNNSNGRAAVASHSSANDRVEGVLHESMDHLSARLVQGGHVAT